MILQGEEDPLAPIGCQTIVAALWRGWDQAAWRELVHVLAYSGHGGSGYAHGYADILEMPASDLVPYTERLEDQREADAKVITRAQARRAR